MIKITFVLFILLLGFILQSSAEEIANGGDITIEVEGEEQEGPENGEEANLEDLIEDGVEVAEGDLEDKCERSGVKGCMKKTLTVITEHYWIVLVTLMAGFAAFVAIKKFKRPAGGGQGGVVPLAGGQQSSGSGAEEMKHSSIEEPKNSMKSVQKESIKKGKGKNSDARRRSVKSENVPAAEGKSEDEDSINRSHSNFSNVEQSPPKPPSPSPPSENGESTSQKSVEKPTKPSNKKKGWWFK